MDTFKNRLKTLRTEKSLTQKALAEALCISVSTLSHWECGYQEPSFRDLLSICDFFEVSIDYLLGRSDDFGVISITNAGVQLPTDAQELVDMFLKLPPDLQHRALTYVNNLLKVNEEEKRLKINKK